jgi:hypothetical protein
MSEAEYRESCMAQGDRCYQENHAVLNDPGVVCVRLDGLADKIARYLVREQSNGLCDENYPNPCDMCDCFNGDTIRYAQAHAAGVVALLQALAVQ